LQLSSSEFNELPDDTIHSMQHGRNTGNRALFSFVAPTGASTMKPAAQRTSRPPRGFGPKKQLIKAVLDSVEAVLKQHSLAHSSARAMESAGRDPEPDFGVFK
jgi:hypothetical protein